MDFCPAAVDLLLTKPYSWRNTSSNGVTVARLSAIVKERSDASLPLVAVVAGTGHIARIAVEAGADILVALNAGLYRNLGVGSLSSFLPFGNANDQTEQLITEQLLPRRGSLPIVAGLLNHDPTMPLSHRFRRLRDASVEGITNWPALGFWEGNVRDALEDAGFGLQAEIDMLKAAQDAGFMSFGFALNEEDAFRFAEGGMDAMILNVGLTHDVRDSTERRNRVQLCASQARQMRSAVRRSGNDPLCLLFGGTVTDAQDFMRILQHADFHGYAGGSAFERIPVADTVSSRIRRFKSLRLPEDDRAGLYGPMIGVSSQMKDLFAQIDAVAPFDVNVCVYGASGTGKELVAGQIHALSGRREHPLVTMNCGAIPDTLVESEFFGFEKGSFTGATQRRLGKFELAHLGTLFLDEVEDLSPHAQAALLRVIQEGEITRIGAQRSTAVDVRILSASNKDLRALVQQGAFREDLYYRLNTVELALSPLRERVEDIRPLVEHILRGIRRRLDLPVTAISRDFERRLEAHSWPGNVRELEHVLIRAALLERSEVLTGKYFSAEHPGGSVGPAASLQPGPHDGDDRAQRAEAALRANRGNKSAAARALGVSRKTLYEWLRRE